MRPALVCRREHQHVLLVIGEGAANAWKFGAAAWALSHLDSPILNVFGGASGWWRRIGESDGRPRGTRSSLGEKRGREGGHESASCVC
jgi:hypothetical protein